MSAANDMPGRTDPSPPALSLQDWVERIGRGHPRPIELGLDRVGAVWRRIGLTLHAAVITVGGTNGKGSCVAMLESMLRAGGYRVGAYSSPHLLRFNERVRVDGSEVDDRTLCRAFEAVESARGEVSLTYFEHVTLAAFWVFARAALEVIVLEVGLGGRLDAVNILDADVALVSTVDLDHQEWLGTGRDSIGREKAGIFRSGHPAVFGGESPPAGLLDHADRIGARLLLAGRDFRARVRDDGWDWEGMGRQRLGLPLPALRGGFQVRNAAAAIAALEAVTDRLPLSTVALRQGLLDVRLPGRFEVFPGPFSLIFDVAHNPEAARALAENLARYAAGRGRTLAVFSMLRDKDIGGVAGILAPQVAEWFYAPLDVGRGATGDELAASLAALGVVAHGHPDLLAALAAAGGAARPGDRILVFGSFYTVAMLLPLARAGAEAAGGPLI
jgi:dihydrofolate synthase / folylpolyglutamate synthase